MSTKMKGIVAAVLALLGAAFGWYVAYSDGVSATVPDTQAVIDAANDVYQATQVEDETTDSDSATTAE